MCFQCPFCNEDEYEGRAADVVRAHQPHRVGCSGCQNMFGSNARLQGGFAGVAQGLAFATEFQGDGTPHGHGFVSLANAYQHSTLEDIARCIESNADFLDRVVKFNTHLQTEEHFDHHAHQKSLDALESSFHKNHDDPKDILMLGLRISDGGKSEDAPLPVDFKHGASSRSKS